MEDKGGLTKSFHPAVRSLDKKRGQSFPLLPVSAGDFLAWTRTSHLICSLTTTTTVLSPRLQFLGSSQKNKAVNKDWARQEGSSVDFLSGLLTVHQLTGQGVILLSSSSEFLYIYGFFSPPHLEHIQIVLLFVLGFSELKSSHCTWLTFLECSSSVWDRLSAPVLWGDTLGKVF